MTAHAAILQAIAIVTEARRANSYRFPADGPLWWWNNGAASVAIETIDRLELLADELKQSELQVVDGMR